MKEGKMPVGQLLMSLASVHTAIGHPLKEELNFPEISYNLTSFLNSFNWVFNSSTYPDLNLLRARGNDEIDGKHPETTTQLYNSTTSFFPETHNADSISIMWYLASFGALVMFFLLISFSEVCCKKSFTMPPEEEVEVSPPPYDLFAPPTYDSLYEEKKEKNQKTKKKKRKYEVFIIPVFGDKVSSRVTPLERLHRNESANGQVTTPPPLP